MLDHPISFLVRLDVARTSPNLRLHRYERNRRNQVARLAAFNEWALGGRPRLSCPVTVDVVIRRARKLDADNALAACKPAIDGLFKDALTEDDSPRWLSIGTVTQETAKEHKGRETVEFIVSPRKEGLTILVNACILAM